MGGGGAPSFATKLIVMYVCRVGLPHVACFCAGSLVYWGCSLCVVRGLFTSSHEFAEIVVNRASDQPGDTIFLNHVMSYCRFYISLQTNVVRIQRSAVQPFFCTSTPMAVASVFGKYFPLSSLSTGIE